MMNKYKYLSLVYGILLWITILMITSCKTPFDTETNDDEMLELKLNHNIIRVMPNAQVNLSWNEITIENFKEYLVERKTITDTTWTNVASLDNEFLTSYQDTIKDDEDLMYRVGICDTDDNILWSTASISIPKTSTVFVPDEFVTIQPAVNSGLTDNGDTILVRPGIYQETISIAGKDILIKSIDGYKVTALLRSVLPDSIDQLRVINILSGTLDGFTIKNGAPMHGSGGGISMGGSATVQNCYIQGNSANSYKNGGYGGGVFIVDNANLYNNIIINNLCTRPLSKGIYALRAHGEIINNTIFGNDILIGTNCSELILRNNIIYDSHPDISFENESSKSGVTVDYSLLDYDIGFGSNNIVEDPQFLDKIDFILSSNSPAINAGHPDSKYNDSD